MKTAATRHSALELDAGTVELASRADVTGDALELEPAASCSTVQLCNAPGSGGTRCRQQGCRLGDAEVEGLAEAFDVGGTPVCPWIFVTRGGAQIDLGAQNRSADSGCARPLAG
jgi:hypothetical protein